MNTLDSAMAYAADLLSAGAAGNEEEVEALVASLATKKRGPAIAIPSSAFSATAVSRSTLAGVVLGSLFLVAAVA
jgi:hypothetical protein